MDKSTSIDRDGYIQHTVLHKLRVASTLYMHVCMFTLFSSHRLNSFALACMHGCQCRPVLLLLQSLTCMGLDHVRVRRSLGSRPGRPCTSLFQNYALSEKIDTNGHIVQSTSLGQLSSWVAGCVCKLHVSFMIPLSLSVCMQQHV
jgi:hypothetical protein